MKWNAVRHTRRPTANHKGARRAWDHFINGEIGRAMADRLPREMTYRFRGYWAWVMEFDNGDLIEFNEKLDRKGT